MLVYRIMSRNYTTNKKSIYNYRRNHPDKIRLIRQGQTRRYKAWRELISILNNFFPLDEN